MSSNNEKTGIQDIESIIQKKGFYMFTGRGYSMWPMLRPYEDAVEVAPAGKKPKVNDVVLFRAGDKYVLHRVIKIHHGFCITRGDNCKEVETVMNRCIIGVMTRFWRGEKKVGLGSRKYRFYCHMILRHRRIFLAFCRLLRKIDPEL